MKTALRPFHVAAALFAAGIAIGTAVDPVPSRAPVYRAGYRVLEADFHAHTTFSDGMLSPFDVVMQARRRGLDVVAITEHNLVFPARLGAWFSHATSGPTVVIGEEITTAPFHVIALGLRDRIVSRQPIDDILDDIDRQGAFAIAAHPVRFFWPALVRVRGRFGGSELMHPLVYGTGAGGWKWSDMREFWLAAREEGHPLTAIGSSDYHWFSPLGLCRTLVFANGDDQASVLDALRHGRTVVYDLDGKVYGDATMVSALAADPYPMRTQDYGYHGAGRLDRIARTLGFLGLLGMFLLRRRAADGA